jgi:hypothetical protein
MSGCREPVASEPAVHNGRSFDVCAAHKQMIEEDNRGT